MIDYTAKRRFIRHHWRGKVFSVFDREQFMRDTMANEIRREIDKEILAEVLKSFKPADLAKELCSVQPIPDSAFKAAHEILGLPPIEPKIILASSDPENVALLKSEGFIPLEELHYEEDSRKKEESGRTGD